MSERWYTAAAVAAAILGFSGAAAAQNYPDHVTEIVVP